MWLVWILLGVICVWLWLDDTDMRCPSCGLRLRSAMEERCYRCGWKNRDHA